MFFLLYVPIVSNLLPPEAIDEMAAHVTDKILQIGSNNNEEASPEHRQELQTQLAEMMRAAQQQRQGALEIVDDGVENLEGAESETPPADGSEAFIRLAPARDFLERCLKKSA